MTELPLAPPPRSYTHTHQQVSFEPGLDGSSKPFGTWWAMGVMVPTPYYDGTDTSMAGSTGVVVNNDVALVWLKPNSANQQVGDLLGYFGWGNNGWSFSAPAAGWGIPTAPATGMLTQFGYPAAFDSGTRMQISNAATYTLSNSNANLRNMIRCVFLMHYYLFCVFLGQRGLLWKCYRLCEGVRLHARLLLGCYRGVQLCRFANMNVPVPAPPQTLLLLQGKCHDWRIIWRPMDCKLRCRCCPVQHQLWQQRKPQHHLGECRKCMGAVNGVVLLS